VTRELLRTLQTEEAARVARDAVERFPLLPRLWLDLALVYRQRGEQDAEAAALDKALEISPGWWDAIELSARLCERRNDLEAAEAALRRGIAASPLDPRPCAALGDVLGKQDRADEARGAFEKALELEPSQDETWASLCAWAQRVGQPDLPAELARRLLRRRPGEASLHYRLATLLEAPEALNERLAALDETIRLVPRVPDGYVAKAELLAENGRFDEARAVLEADAWSGRRPAALRLCASTLCLMEGRAERALEIAREVQKDEPRSIPAWLQIARCQQARQDAAGYLAAHRAAHELAPANPVLTALLANAHLVNNQIEPARRLLERVVRDEPDYLDGAMGLLDVLLAQKDAPAIETLLATLRTHGPAMYALSGEVQLAALAKDRDRALVALGELLRTRGAERGVLDPAVGRLMEHGRWVPAVQRLLEEAARENCPGASLAAETWMRFFAARTTFRDCTRLIDALAGEDRQRAALVAYCEQYVQGGHRHRNVADTLVRRYEQVFWADTTAWAWAGCLFDHDGRNRDVQRWMEGWRQREVREAWMLQPLATALFCAGDYERSAEVSVAALGLTPDGSVPVHQALVAWARCGQPETAQDAARRTRGLNTAGLWPVYALLVKLTSIVAEVNAAGPEGRAQRATAGMGRVRRCWKRWGYKGDPIAARLRQEARQALFDAGGGPWYDRWLATPAGRVVAVLLLVAFGLLFLILAARLFAR
jgi:tetratricopeptide (TPR) repeat protein